MRSRAILRSRARGAVVLLLVGAAACSSGGSSGSKATTTTVASSVVSTTAVARTTSAPATTAPPSSTAPTTAGATTTTAPTGAQDLVITDAQRAQLLAAAAAHNSIPAAEYTGLRKGVTYYAYDATTKTYWAGASLVPSDSSLRAQVSTQDDGAYYVFSEPAGGTWSVWSTGADYDPDGRCPMTVPAEVLRVWAWRPGACVPPV